MSDDNSNLPINEQHVRKPFDLERFLGVQLPIWGGALMLLFAGYFLIQWISSLIEFTPEMKVGSSLLASAITMFIAFFIKGRNFPLSQHISSAIASTAIALGYGTIYLATSFFQIIPEWMSLIGGFAIVAGSIYSVSYFGKPVLLMGFFGGYLTPIISYFGNVDPNTYTIYLALINICIFFSFQKISPNLLKYAVIPGVIYTVELFVNSRSNISLAFMVSSFAIAATFSALFHKKYDSLSSSIWILSSAFLLIFTSSFIEPNHAIAVIALTALPGIILTWKADIFDQLSRGIIPVSILTAVLISSKLSDLQTLYISTLLIVVFGGATYFRPKANNSIEIAYLIGVAATAISITLELLSPFTEGNVASVVFLLSAALYGYLHYTRRSENVLSFDIFLTSSLIALFVSLAHINTNFFTPYIAATAVLIIISSFSIRQNSTPTKIFFFKLIHIPFIILVSFEVFFSILDSTSTAAIKLLVPMFIIPILFLGHTYSEKEPSKTSNELTVFSIMLMSLYAIIIAVKSSSNIFASSSEFYASYGFTISTFAAMALLLSTIGHTHKVNYLSKVSSSISILLYATIFVGGVLPLLRLWPSISIPGPIFFNSSLLVLFIPSVLVTIASYLNLKSGGNMTFYSTFRNIGITFSIINLLVIIRHGFFGEYLNNMADVRIGNNRLLSLLFSPTSAASFTEIILMTIAMMTSGMAVLFAGVKYKDKGLRILSLCILLCTSLKLFVIDMYNLEGVARIASFFGLGISLLVVSFVFGRFVFKFNSEGVPHSTEPSPS